MALEHSASVGEDSQACANSHRHPRQPRTLIQRPSIQRRSCCIERAASREALSQSASAEAAERLEIARSRCHQQRVRARGHGDAQSDGAGEGCHAGGAGARAFIYTVSLQAFRRADETVLRVAVGTRHNSERGAIRGAAPNAAANLIGVWVVLQASAIGLLARPVRI